MQVLAVTSAVTREGKTSLAAQLAVSIARASGEKTLLIDADMRSPDLYQVFDIPNDRGLVDVLADECTIDEAIVTEHSDLLHVLPAGKLRASPHKLVGDGSFEKVIGKLRDRYRYIVIDTPPILSASESLVLAVAADATVLCAMRDYSRTKQVRTAYRRLEAADANPVGVVLNGVSISRYTYSYGRYVYPAN
jgi:capsular exopolysaccharide synthesis family protein